MSKSPISDPEKFELASAVSKNSKSGITSNRRLLVIKRGHLYYYSNVPKFFKGDPKILQNFHELPKCSIDIVNIKEIKETDSQSNQFSIVFEAKNMLEREDIRKTIQNQEYNFATKNTTEEVCWKFTCDSPFIKQRWVSALGSLKEYYKNEQIHIQKYFEGINGSNGSKKEKDEEALSFGSHSSRSSLKLQIPWRESSVSRKSVTAAESKNNVTSPKFLLDFNNSSPKNEAKIEQLNLSKVKSDDGRSPNKEIMLVTKKQYKKERIEDAFTIHRVEKKTIKQEEKFNLPIQYLSEDNSVNQTPIKEHSIAYSDKQPDFQMKDSNSTGKIDQTKLKLTESYFVGSDYKIKQLDVVEKKPELNKNDSIYLSLDHSEVKEMGNSTSKQPRVYYENVKANDNKQSMESPKQKMKKTLSQYIQFDTSFYQLFGDSCNSNLSFRDKLSKQKEWIGYMNLFRQKVISGLSQYIESKKLGQENYKILEQSNNIVVLEMGNIIYKIGLVTTQNIIINGKEKIYFNEENIKNIKRQFKIYKQLFQMASRNIKSQSSSKIRVPLAIYLEYKGICCLAFEQKGHEQPINFSQQSQQLWTEEQNILKKYGYSLDYFNFKTIQKTNYFIVYLKVKGRNFLNNEQTLKEYLKRILRMTERQKHHNLSFEPPIDKTFLQIAHDDQASTSIQSLEKYIKGLKCVKNFQGVCPKQEIIVAFSYCLYCKQLRKIYRSAQGQIDETHFFNLVFKQDPSMMALLNQSSCSELPQIYGSFFSFIDYYFGVTLEIDDKAMQDYRHSKSGKFKQDLIISSSIRPLVRQYPLKDFETYESFNKLNLYLESHHYLAGKALEIKKEIFYLNTENLSLDNTLQIIYNEASLFYQENDYIACIKKCKQYEEICNPLSTRLVPIYLLMIKSYSQFSQADHSQTLNKLTDLIQFNYGPNHSCLMNLFCLCGFYFCKLANNPNASKAINLTEVGIQFVKKAQQLCRRHFGASSKQFLDILLDLSKLHRSIDSHTCINYLQEAKKLYSSATSLVNDENLLCILLHQIDLFLNLGLIPRCEISIINALKVVGEKTSVNHLKQLYKLQYEFGFYSQKYSFCQRAIEELWKFGLSDKIEALQFAYKTALREGQISESDNLMDENDSVRFESKEKVILEIQQEKSLHNSLVEMVASALQANNIKFLTLIYYLINKN